MKEKAFPVWFWDACRSWDLSVHPLATAFLNKVTAYWNPDLFFCWQSPQLRTRPQASQRFLHRGEKLHIILGSFVQTANWLGVWPPGPLGVPSQADVLVLTVDLSDLSFRTQSLAFEHQALWGPSDNRLGIFSSFFPHNLKIKVSAMKYFPLEMHQHACEHPPETLCKVVKAPPVRGILKTDYFPLRSCLPRLFSTQGGDAHFI